VDRQAEALYQEILEHQVDLLFGCAGRNLGGDVVLTAPKLIALEGSGTKELIVLQAVGSKNQI
jgi:hypothetical protein